MLSSSSSESEKEYPEINDLENVEQSLTPGEDERGIGNALDQVVMDLREEGVDELRDEGIHEEVPLCSGEGFLKNEFIVSKSKEELQQWPDFIQDRIQLFDKLMAKHKEELASKTIQPITISLGNGKDIKGQSWKTTPLQIAISRGLELQAVVAKVNDELWDLDRPFEGDATLKILKFDDDEGKAVFWHSSAHILGEAVERYCGAYLCYGCYGPPTDDGFYCDMFKENLTIKQKGFKKLEEIAKCAVKDEQPFERLEMSKVDLLEMFKYNEFKCRIINEKVKTDKTTVYRCGPLIDLCRGPLVRHAGKIKALAVTKCSSFYWEGNAEMESLQRISGISFSDPKQLKEWQKLQEEAA